jgi:hypothetical protein
VGEDLRVARVRCLAAEDRRRPPRAAEELVEQRQLQLPIALAAEFRPQVRGPQPPVPDLLLQGPGERTGLRVGLVVGVTEQQVQRFDLLADELVDPVELYLVVGIGPEVPRHAETVLAGRRGVNSGAGRPL